MHISAVGNVYYRKKPQDAVFNPQPLYTAPPKKQWVGLTNEDLDFWGGELGLGELGKGILRAVDAHLREKNVND
jgi:hypothetical protein